VAQTPRGAPYAASEPTGRIGDRDYRLVVDRSSSLARRKAKTLDWDLPQTRAVAEQAAAVLSAQDFACAADAEAATTTFAGTAPRWWPCYPTVAPITLTDKRARPGRPRRDDPTPTHTIYRVTVTWGSRDDAAVETELARRSTFVPITTLPADRYDTAALLREHKGQTGVAQRFHFLKYPALVDAVFLQKPERIQALGYVMLLALLLFSRLERQVRHAPEPFPTAYRGRVAHPTGQIILHHDRGIPVMWRNATHRYLAVPTAHRPAVRMILEALTLTETIYTTRPGPPRCKYLGCAGTTCGSQDTCGAIGLGCGRAPGMSFRIRGGTSSTKSGGLIALIVGACGRGCETTIMRL
jgi:transposase